MLEMAPRDHVANIPLQKFGCGGLPGSGSVFGQVRSAGRMLSRAQEFMHFLHLPLSPCKT